MKTIFVALTALCLLVCSSTHNILVFLPLPIKSHYVQVEPIFYSLAQRRHNVTVMSRFPPEKEMPNLNHIYLAADEWHQKIAGVNPMELFLSRPHHMFRLSFWEQFANQLLPEVLSNPVFKNLIHGDSQFDLIFTELFFSQELFIVLGRVFKAPVVTYSSFGYTTDILRYAGATNAFSYIPDKEFNYAGPMSLLQRLDNALFHCASMIYNEYWYYPNLDVLISEHIPGKYPRVSDMLSDISLYFLTANIAVDGAKLYPPNVVEISGIHIKEPSPLDKESKSIMDNAKNGVIYFSYGSLLQASHFRKEVIQAFLSVFQRLDQFVLWKSDLNASDWMIPKNVLMRGWFDQTSILAHPNCVLFLTHGGISSTMETILHAVPVIGVSFYGDQMINLANMEYHGYGLQLSYENITQKSLSWAIKTILEDARFKKNVSRASRIFTDKPMSSLDTAIYWIEYVIRHQGAYHLKPLAARIPWYQLFLLDVIAIFFVTIIVLFYVVLKLTLILYRIFVKKSSSSKKKKS